jgi:Na+-driven multidrug efflux pump
MNQNDKRPMAQAQPASSPVAKAVLPADKRATMLRSGAILSTLLLLTLPNLVALGSSAIVSIAETAYVGMIGVSALGGIALAFPIFMLMQMLSAGAMGGTISGAISRALGAGNLKLAQALALCSIVIAIVLGSGFAALVRGFGSHIYASLGGDGPVLGEALAFSNAAAWAIPGIWLANTLASILRGTGNMAVPAATLLSAGLIQVAVGGALGLGIGPIPALGIAGVAFGQVVAFWAATLYLVFYLRSENAPIGLGVDRTALRAIHFSSLLRVGSVAMLSPILSIASILVLTRLVAEFGPEALAGYGIGVRLEFLLIPIAFSVGVASVPMVGTALGTGNVERARRIAWISGGLAFVAIGLVGLVMGVSPELWVDLFTNAVGVRGAAYSYLGIAGFGFGFFGLGLCLYFASQGSGRMGGVIFAQTLRFAIIVAGGSIILKTSENVEAIFVLSAAAMVTMGVATVIAVKLTRWIPS